MHFLPTRADQCVSEFGMQEVGTDCFRFVDPHPCFRGRSGERGFGCARRSFQFFSRRQIILVSVLPFEYGLSANFGWLVAMRKRLPQR